MPRKKTKKSVGLHPAQWKAVQSDARFIALVGGKSSGKCLGLDTKVPLSNGGTKYAKDVLVGDEVFCKAPSDKVVTDIVARSFTTGVQLLHKVTTSSGRSINITAEHPLFTSDGWVSCKYLREDESIAVPLNIKVGSSLIWDKVVSIKQIGPRPTCDLTMKNYANFVANDIFAHNTWCGPKWLYKEISQHPGEDWMVVAPTFGMLQDAALDELWKFFEDTDLEGEDRGLRNKKRYDLPDGGRIYYRSADRPDSLEAIHVKGAWVDEAGQISRQAWHKIIERLSGKSGRAFLSSTPYRINWFKHEFYDYSFVETLGPTGKITKTEGDPRSDYHVIQFPSVLNPTFDEGEFEDRRNSLSKAEFDMVYRGRFTQLQGLVYPNFMQCVVDFDPYTPVEADQKIGSIDPGMSDPFGAITAVWGDDDNVHLLHETYEPDMLLRDLKQYLDPYAVYYMDPAAKRERKELESMGFDVRKAINDIGPGVRKVNEFIADKRLVIPDEKFPNLIDEAQAYQYDTKKDKPDKSTPHHLLDCLRYLLMGLEDTGGMEVYIL